MATAKFNQQILANIPEKAHLLPLFDARVYQYPTLDLAAESFVWRETDATRNSLFDFPLTSLVRDRFLALAITPRSPPAGGSTLHSMDQTGLGGPRRYLRLYFCTIGAIVKAQSHDECRRSVWILAGGAPGRGSESR